MAFENYQKAERGEEVIDENTFKTII